LIYHSTPHRGLEILVPVFIELCKHHDNLQLDVYSSFNLYGWGQRDAEYQKLLKICQDHPNIKYYGTVSNDDLRIALCNADIFAYPSIWQETSCLSLIEAMSAKLLCVHPNLAALPETSMGLTWMYQWNEDKQSHAQQFFQVLHQAINVMTNERDKVKFDLDLQKVQVDRNHNWQGKALEWTALLESLSQ
jgi:hypothetical protein